MLTARVLRWERESTLSVQANLRKAKWVTTIVVIFETWYSLVLLLDVRQPIGNQSHAQHKFFFFLGHKIN